MENRGKYISKGKGQDFKNAVTQIDEYMSDREVFHSILLLSEIYFILRFK